MAATTSHGARSAFNVLPHGKATRSGFLRVSQPRVAIVLGVGIEEEDRILVSGQAHDGVEAGPEADGEDRHKRLGPRGMERGSSVRSGLRGARNQKRGPIPCRSRVCGASGGMGIGSAFGVRPTTIHVAPIAITAPARAHWQRGMRQVGGTPSVEPVTPTLEVLPSCADGGGNLPREEDSHDPPGGRRLAPATEGMPGITVSLVRLAHRGASK